VSGCSGAPAQPLRFDHRAHKQAGVQCQVCHRGARTETWAGLPGVQDCLACHAFDLPGHPDVARNLDIARLRALGVAGAKSIAWGGLYALAPFARFSHRAHAHAKVACHTCHGGTGEREVSERENPRTEEALMDWCISCHREKKAATDCLTCHL
jgi:cytochrome c7-like protein/class III cytochrome C family protein